MFFPYPPLYTQYNPWFKDYYGNRCVFFIHGLRLFFWYTKRRLGITKVKAKRKKKKLGISFTIYFLLSRIRARASARNAISLFFCFVISRGIYKRTVTCFDAFLTGGINKTDFCKDYFKKNTGVYAFDCIEARKLF